jgi:hypothetical protein
MMPRITWSFQPEPWLVEEVNRYANIHKLDVRSDALHGLVKELLAQKTAAASRISSTDTVQSPTERPPPSVRPELTQFICPGGDSVSEEVCFKCARQRFLPMCPKGREIREKEGADGAAVS